MQRVAVRGLVRLANDVRRELARPLSESDVEQITRRVAAGTQFVDELLAKQGLTLASLPRPTRNAYTYLKKINVNEIAQRGTHVEQCPRPESIRFVGLNSFLEQVLDRLALAEDERQCEEIYDAIHSTSRKLAEHMRVERLVVEQVKSNSRRAKAWFDFFSQRPRFDQYVAAISMMQDAIAAVTDSTNQITSPVIVHFRPLKAVYRVRIESHKTCLHLPVSMIVFDQENFAHLVRMVVRREGDKHALLRHTQSPEYTQARSEFESLVGDTAVQPGLFHDLAASFARVNAAYLDGTIRSRPIAITTASEMPATTTIWMATGCLMMSTIARLWPTRIKRISMWTM